MAADCPWGSVRFLAMSEDYRRVRASPALSVILLSQEIQDRGGVRSVSSFLPLAKWLVRQVRERVGGPHRSVLLDRWASRRRAAFPPCGNFAGEPIMR